MHPDHNLLVGWIWITAGFISGFITGLFFHDEKWLGGYSSFRRRLYRLGHVAFFGMGIMNLLFYFTTHIAGISGDHVSTMALCFVIGAIGMPLCCYAMAHWSVFRYLFAVPVVSLLAAAILMVIAILSA